MGSKASKALRKSMNGRLKHPEEQECLWFSSDQKTSPMRMRFPPTVMVFDVVGSKEHILTPHFFPQGLRINTDADAYVGTLQTIVVKPPWIARPTKLADLDPSDYYVWGEAERDAVRKEVNRHPLTTKPSSLMEAIGQAMNYLNKDYLI
ncbi:hypothetical protein ACTXT7_007436 [Hymenolepis weldensis]